MGGGYPSGRSWNFWGSDPNLAAHVISTWEGRIVYVGDDVGKYVKTGGLLMTSGPATDPVCMAYIYYGYYAPLSSWDPLAILYAADGLGDLFKLGNEYGYNHVEASDGSNQWIWDEQRQDQFFLRLKADNETAAARVDELFLQGAEKFANSGPKKTSLGGKPLRPTTSHEEL